MNKLVTVANLCQRFILVYYNNQLYEQLMAKDFMHKSHEFYFKINELQECIAGWIYPFVQPSRYSNVKYIKYKQKYLQLKQNN
jgi:hypothetical protein